MVSAERPSATAGSGWTTARFSIHGSRGRTQVMRSGGTPLSRSHTIPSVAVLPEPTITYWRGALVNRASSLTATTSTSSATANGGGVVAGIVGDRYVASTIRRRTSTRTVLPETCEVTRCEEPSAWCSDPPRKVTRPEEMNRRCRMSS